jgi:hypothetical protein
MKLSATTVSLGLILLTILPGNAASKEDRCFPFDRDMLVVMARAKAEWSEEQKLTLIAAHRAGKAGWCPECNRSVEASIVRFPSPKPGGPTEEVTLTCRTCANLTASYQR